MTIGSLFSGIGGFELGLERAGLGPVVWQVEINADARCILETHWPEAARFGDIRTVDATQLADVDLVCGGFPCQDISPAGRRRGLAGARSGLWLDFARIVGDLLPRWVCIENNGHRWRSWVPVVRSHLGQLGYASMPLLLRASDLGAAHERSRCFVVADRLGVLLPARDDDPPNADGARELQPGWPLRKVREWASDGLGWPTEPDVARVVHGLSARVDRVRRRRREEALGNAVCPPVAEAVGRFIRAMAEA